VCLHGSINMRPDTVPRNLFASSACCAYPQISATALTLFLAPGGRARNTTFLFAAENFPIERG